MSITAERVRYSKPSATKFFATFGYAWFTIGLFTGTLVLVLAVRGILNVLHRLGWGQVAQNRLFMVVIVLFVVGSFMLARRVVRMLYRLRPGTRKAALVALAVPALLSGYAWSNPTKFLAGFAGTESSSLAMAGGPNFMFGSYPDDAHLRELKAKGVTAVVSLQSPAVVVEISGINEERKSAERAGLQFIEAPMLPWVSDNTESLEKIKQLALTGKGTYYVHCGLGRDRVNIAKRVIESLQSETHARVASTTDLKHAIGFERRTEPFERGMPMKVQDGVWVVPFLNKEEFYGFILQGQPGHVILALNPADSVQRLWIADAEKQFRQYAVSYTAIAYPRAAGDTSTAAVMALVKAQKPPFTVIVPKTTFSVGDPKDPVARAIGKAFGVSVKPMPKTMQLAPGETLLAPVVVPGRKAE
ncbi:MAG: hypothetical protein ABIY52_14520 [Gemmatimonadaceae bacterium]